MFLNVADSFVSLEGVLTDDNVLFLSVLIFLNECIRAQMCHIRALPGALAA